MFRYIAGGVGVLLLVAAGFFIWTSRSERPGRLPAAPHALAASILPAPAGSEAEPESDAPPPADERTREQKRFDRADKDKNGRVTLAELLEPRRKPFAKLDTNGDGRLSFEEWTVRTNAKFALADKDRDGALTRVEYATTKPKRSAKAKCACSSPDRTAESDRGSDAD